MKFRKAILASLLLCLLLVGVGEAADADIVRLGVMRFTSKAAGVSDMQAATITDIFTRTLANSRSIALIERERLDMIGAEHRLNMSGLVDMGMAIEVGRLAGCQYMLLGSVTGLEERASGGGFGGIVAGSRVAEATIDVRVVDVQTSEIILTLVQKGSYTQESSAFMIGGMNWREVGLSDIKAGAVADCASRLGHRIREELVGEYTRVLSVSGKSVNINIGSTSGAQAGDLYLVYSDGREMLDFDGTSLGREKHPIAVVRVRTVSSGFSAAEVVPSGGKVELIHRGDKVEPISSKESQELAKNKRLATERPRRRAYDETAETLFGGTTSDAPESDASFSFDQPLHSDSPNPPPAPSRSSFENSSTDPAKVVDTYPLNPGDKNLRRVGHINARKLRGQRAYDAYVDLANSYSGDYLAAYQAGEEARKLRKQADARDWYAKALAINPDYKPALDASAKLK